MRDSSACPCLWPLAPGDGDGDGESRLRLRLHEKLRLLLPPNCTNTNRDRRKGKRKRKAIRSLLPTGIFQCQISQNWHFSKVFGIEKVQFYLLFDIEILSTIFTVWHLNFLETVNKTSNLAFFDRGFGILVTGEPGIAESDQPTTREERRGGEERRRRRKTCRKRRRREGGVVLAWGCEGRREGASGRWRRRVESGDREEEVAYST